MNSTELTLILPIVIPLVTALLAMFFRRHVVTQRAISITGLIALSVSAILLFAAVQRYGVISVQIGDWPAPFGITFAADRLAALMIGVSALIALAGGIYSIADLSPGRERYGHHPLLHLLMMGVNGAFLTGDLFNLYVWFEVMLIASFVLMTLGGRRAQLEGAIKYVTLNLLGSMLFLASIGLLYNRTGTLNFAELHGVIGTLEGDGLLLTVSILFMIAFGIKAGLFPLFMWLPSSYHTPPPAISAIFAGLLTKVGVYALIRAFTMLFVYEIAWTHTLLLILASLTMVTGVLGAVVQGTVRRILSFHIVSQIGYMVFGLALYTVAGLAGAVFYIIHHIVVKTNLFLIGGVVTRVKGAAALREIGGLARSHVALSILFLIPALSLAGIPPLSGFWAKFAVIKAGFDANAWWPAGIALVVGVLTLFSMMKIWREAFWKPQPGGDSIDNSGPKVRESGETVEFSEAPLDRRYTLLTYGPIMVLAAVTLFFGLYPSWLAEHAFVAGEQLLDPAPYIQAVLGEAAP